MSDTEILYNASCPICAREIAAYRRMGETADAPFRFDDLNDKDALARWGIAPEDAARRLHVRHEGQILTGVDAFAALWDQLPRLRWLSRVIRLPGVHWLAAKTYDHMLAPSLFALHKRRNR